MIQLDEKILDQLINLLEQTLWILKTLKKQKEYADNMKKLKQELAHEQSKGDYNGPV